MNKDEFDRQADDSLRTDRHWTSYVMDAFGRMVQRFVDRVILGGLKRK